MNILPDNLEKTWYNPSKHPTNPTMAASRPARPWATVACLLLVFLAAQASAFWDPDGPGPAATSRLDDVAPGAWIVVLSDSAKPPVVADASASKAFRVAHPRRSVARAQAAAVGTVSTGAAAARQAAKDEVAAYTASLKDEQLQIFQSVVASSAASPTAARAADGSAGPAAAVAGPAGAGGARIAHHFTVTLNGFSAHGLTDAQAAALRADPRVRSVTPAMRVRPLTTNTPAFLGLSGTGGVWESFGGPNNNIAGNVLIGVIDTGARRRAPQQRLTSQLALALCRRPAARRFFGRATARRRWQLSSQAGPWGASSHLRAPRAPPLARH
jgi:hypothetical protein